MFTAEVKTITGFESSSRSGAATGTKLETWIGVGIRFWLGLSLRTADSSWKRS